MKYCKVTGLCKLGCAKFLEDIIGASHILKKMRLEINSVFYINLFSIDQNAIYFQRLRQRHSIHTFCNVSR